MALNALRFTTQNSYAETVNMKTEESSQKQKATLSFNSNMELNNNMIGFNSDLEINQLMSATAAQANIAGGKSFELGLTLKKDLGFASRNNSTEGDEYGKILNNEIKVKVSNESEVSEEVSLEESKATNETPLIRETPPLQPSGSKY